jgi:multidrug efflux pump
VNVEVFIRRPVMASVLSLLIMVLGLVSVTRLGVQETPDITSPVVTVNTTYPGAAPAVVEAEVTEVLERELNGIEGLATISSTSRDQSSQISLEFDLERDLEEAANDVRDRVARAGQNLPETADPPVVSKADGDARPVMYLRLVGERSLLELSELADVLLRERLQRVSGVSAVEIYGERRYAMRIELDPLRLAARGMTVLEVQQALDARNVDAPAGRVEGPVNDVSLRVAEGLDTPEDFERLVLRTSGSGEVRLGDVARVRLGAEDERSAARADGVPAITVAVVPLTGANIIQISDEVRRRLPDVRADLPPDLTLDVNYDRSIPVRASIRDVLLTLGLSALIVVVVIFAFLRSARATIVPATAIVVSLIGTFTAMWAFGLTLNVFTLFGLVLAIGLVVDDAIVVLENVWRHIELGKPPLEAAVEGTGEITFPVIATTVSLVAVFLPVVFAGGASGRLFYEFGITVAVSVVISTVVALTLSPALSGRLLSRRGESQDAWPPAVVFGRTLQPLLDRPWISFVTVALTVAAGAWTLWTVPQDFFPNEDRSFFIIRLAGPEGASFAWTDARVRELEPDVIAAIPERTGVLSRVGSGRGGLPGVANTAFLAVPVVPPEDRTRSQQEIVAAVRPLVSRSLDLQSFIVQPSPISRGFSAPLQYVLQADDQAQLAEVLPGFMEALRGVEGLSGLDVDLKLDRPELSLRVDGDATARLGVSIAEVARTLQILSNGLELDQFRRGSRQYAVIVSLQSEARDAATDLEQVYVRGAGGVLIPLSAVARFEEEAAASSRFHYDRAPSATISASPDGITLGEAIDRVDLVAKERLPAGMRTALAGTAKDFGESNDSLTMVFGLALVLVYLVLAAQFDSFLDPVPILISLPVAVAGGLGALVVTGESMSFFAQVGLILLVGLVTKNGILLVELAVQRRDDGLPPYEAAAEAARLRLRPILMTTLSTIGGAVPIALGASGETRASLGLIVVGGMITSTVLSLYVTPVVWAWLQGWRGQRAPAAVVAAALLVVGPARADELTLGRVLQLAAEGAPVVRAAELDAAAGRAGIGEARAGALPELTASGRAQYGNTFVAGGAGVGGDPFALASVSGRLDVPLLAPSVWSNIGVAASGAEVARARADAEVLGVLQRAAGAWLDLQRAHGVQSAAEESVRLARTLLDVATDRASAGAGTRLEVVRAEVQLRRDELTALQAGRDVAAARAWLAATLGTPLAGSDLPSLQPLPEPPALQVETHPELRAAQASVVTAQALRRATLWQLAPQVSVFGEVGTLTRFEGAWLPTTAVGVQLSVSPISGATLTAAHRQRLQWQASMARVTDVRERAQAALEVAVADLEAARAALSLADQTRALAEEELALASDRFEVGAGEQLDVLRAQQTRAEVAREQVDALVSWGRAVVSAHVAAGSLGALRGR